MWHASFDTDGEIIHIVVFFICCICRIQNEATGTTNRGMIRVHEALLIIIWLQIE